MAEHPIDPGLVTDLARKGLGSVAPEELLTFQRTADAYFEDPQGMLSQTGAGDEALGFGVGEAVVLVAPVALAVAADIVKYVYEELREVVVEGGGKALAERLRRLFRRDKEEANGTSDAADSQHGAGDGDAGVGLSQQQLARVHAIAIERAKQFLPDDKASLLADSMTGALVIQPG